MLETSAKPTNGHIENGVHSEKTGGSAQSSIEKKIRSLKIMFLLATAYSSNIGGWYFGTDTLPIKCHLQRVEEICR